MSQGCGCGRGPGPGAGALKVSAPPAATSVGEKRSLAAPIVPSPQAPPSVPPLAALPWRALAQAPGGAIWCMQP
jgi:hypothetical protein